MKKIRLSCIAEIVAVNGQPAKGVALYRARTVNLTPTLVPGNTISDVERHRCPRRR